MKTDERIRQTKNNIASQGFGIWYVLLLAVLLYRQFYLRQTLQEYWDIALIFFLGTFYVAIAGFAKGAVYEKFLGRYMKLSVPLIVLTIIALNYFQGRLRTIADLISTLIFSLIGIAVIGLIFYFLNKRWERNIET